MFVVSLLPNTVCNHNNRRPNAKSNWSSNATSSTAWKKRNRRPWSGRAGGLEAVATRAREGVGVAVPWVPPLHHPR